MEELKKLCRVCMCPEDKQMVELSKENIEKLVHIGDSTKFLIFDDQPPLLCVDCKAKLDFVYNVMRAVKPMKQNDPYIFFSDVGEQSTQSSNESNESSSVVGDLVLGDVPEDEREFCSSRPGGSLTKDTVCHICKKTFSSKSNKKRHEFLHLSSGRVYACPYDNCIKTFTQQASLKYHILVHEGVRTFSCLLCGKNFYRNQALQLHLNLHTGESLYTCDYCGKGFMQKCNLKRHFLSQLACKPLIERRAL